MRQKWKVNKRNLIPKPLLTEIIILLPHSAKCGLNATGNEKEMIVSASSSEVKLNRNAYVVRENTGLNVSNQIDETSSVAANFSTQS